MSCRKKVKCPSCTLQFNVVNDGVAIRGRHIPTVCAEPECGQHYFHKAVTDDQEKGPAVVTIAASEVNPAWEIIGDDDGNKK